MKKIIVTLLLLAIPLISYHFLTQTTEAEAEEPQPNQILEVTQPIKTNSSFEIKYENVTKTTPFETIYKEDPEKEAGVEETIQEGEEGKISRVMKIIYHQGKEYAQEIASEEAKPAKDRIVVKGTKIIWREIDTPEGPIRYWKKMRVYATHYDSRCRGCNETTAIGMRAGKGVIAVDPKVIKLRSRVYIPGYGKAVAGDTGGAIKGKIIDLGFEDARTSGWRAQFVDIYILE